MTHSNETYLFFQQVQNHFIKRGKRETLENYFRDRLEARARSKKRNMYSLLANGMLSSTPFIKLKSKKRRKYTIYKVHFAEREWSRRKGVGSFAKAIKEQKSKDLFSAIEKELTLLQTGKSNVLVKRDDYHKLALKVTPYRWKKLVYLKQRREKRRKEKLRRQKERAKVKALAIAKAKVKAAAKAQAKADAQLKAQARVLAKAQTNASRKNWNKKA